MPSYDSPLFREEQRIAQRLLLTVLVIDTLVIWGIIAFALYREVAMGQRWAQLSMLSPLALTAIAIAFLVPLVLLILMMQLRVVTEVHRDGLTIRLLPFNRRPYTMPLDQVTHIERTTFDAMREYGGWGVRGTDADRAVIGGGNQGVRLTFRDGRRLLIGSRRPDDLMTALQRVIR